VIGLRVNNYEVKSILGVGGMGTVYLAEHLVMGRKAAIKILKKELAEDPTLVARFINEARAANSIGHPNIIDVIDVGTLADHGVPYMMMEFLEGQSLAARLAKLRTLSVTDAVEIAVQTASALSAAHAKGIIHRDLKPDNLFLVPDQMLMGRERVKVLDFGIAKLRGEIGSGSVKTNAGAIMGTPPYMSPEQCRGIVEEIDHRTDVYALGIILYEMLTGAPPFVSPGYGEVLVMHITQAPKPPRAINSNIPEVLEQLILAALAKKADERIASMSAFHGALMPFRAHSVGASARYSVHASASLHATPTPEPSSATTFSAMASEIYSESPARKSPVLIAVVAAGLVAAAVGAVLTFGGKGASSSKSASPVSSSAVQPSAAAVSAAPVPEKTVPARPASKVSPRPSRPGLSADLPPASESRRRVPRAGV
jgi:eukaryotic-like serine/threonine-protein kinase